MSGKEKHRRPWLILENNIKMTLLEAGWGGGHGLDRSGSGNGKMAEFCECDNEPSGSIKYEEFLD